MIKSILLSTFVSIICTTISYSQFATDVTVTDCKSNTYNLFNELDAGKIIVIGWAMPCSSCAPPLLDVHNAVLNYEISNPGVVKYWICDDYGNTSCSSLNGWVMNNGMNNSLVFSTPLLDMGDYGSDGMPKVVVVGCSSHKVYYNVNNNPSGSGVTAAINQALSDMASSCVTGIESVENDASNIQLFPNPSVDKCSFRMENHEEIELIKITSVNGEEMLINNWEVENDQVVLNIGDLTEGMYFLSVQTANNTSVTRFEKTK